jgi:hypothetical protein
MRWMGMVVLLVFSAGAVAGEMWRWVDERGIVHYSDRPHPGAERVELGPAQTYTAPELPPPRPAAPEPPAEPVPSYARLSIVSPEEGEMLWNIGGELGVELDLQPPLRDGHQLRVYLDGERVADVPQASGRFTIGEVYRGEHTLRASIVDDRGRELVSSATTTFYVQQASILNPNRPRQRPGAGGG